MVVTVEAPNFLAALAELGLLGIRVRMLFARLQALRAPLRVRVEVAAAGLEAVTAAAPAKAKLWAGGAERTLALTDRTAATGLRVGAAAGMAGVVAVVAVGSTAMASARQPL
jgi:hypothetical protein